MALKYTPVCLIHSILSILHVTMFDPIVPDMHHNSKLLKHRNFIKNTINVCLTALNDWKDVEIYSQKWRKSLQKDRFSCSCFCLFSLQGLN